MMKNTLIPDKIAGKNTDLKHSTTAATREQAMLMYQVAYNRLLNPATWHQLSGNTGAEFILVSKDAQIKNCLAKEGDYFRIDIPGPGPASGEGYDWVRVEAINESRDEAADTESCGLKVRPTEAPGKDSNTPAHFFKKGATSTFIISRNGRKLTATYHGRNELPNNEGEAKADNIRNTLVALGAIAGLSELQWQALLKGILSQQEIV